MDSAAATCCREATCSGDLSGKPSPTAVCVLLQQVARLHYVPHQVTRA